MSKLSEEIKNDPLGRGYDGMTDDQIVTSLTAVDIEIDVKVPMRDLLTYLIENDKWADILDASTNNGHAARKACLAFTTICNNVNFSDLDLTNSSVGTLITALTTNNLLEAADVTAITAMGKKNTSRAQQEGLGTIGPGIVEVARR